MIDLLKRNLIGRAGFLECSNDAKQIIVCDSVAATRRRAPCRHATS